MLSGNLLSENLYADPNFPRTSAIIKAFSSTFSLNDVLYPYLNVSRRIHQARGSNPRRLETAEQLLALLLQSPRVALISDLRLHGARLWGCVPKDDVDIARFGIGTICLNADTALALESATDRYVELVCKTMLAVTFAHEAMHLLHHRILPGPALENTPPGIGSDTGESGWALEMELLGGHVAVTWKSTDGVGNLHDIERLMLQRRNRKQYLLTLPIIERAITALEAGSPLAFVLDPEIEVEDLPLPFVNTRAPPSSPALQIPLGLAMGFKPGEVTTWVGQDRLPLALPIFHDTIEAPEDC